MRFSKLDSNNEPYLTRKNKMEMRDVHFSFDLINYYPLRST